MGAALSSAISDCADSALSCPSGAEPQEVCVYGAMASHGPQAHGFLCDWHYNATCTSRLDSCACPGAQPDTLASSALAPYVEDSALFVYGGPVLLWGLTLVLPTLYTLPSLKWERSFGLPRAMHTMSRSAFTTWISL
jgi:hypothetical protein